MGFAWVTAYLAIVEGSQTLMVREERFKRRGGYERGVYNIV